MCVSSYHMVPGKLGTVETLGLYGHVRVNMAVAKRCKPYNMFAFSPPPIAFAERHRLLRHVHNTNLHNRQDALRIVDMAKVHHSSIGKHSCSIVRNVLVGWLCFRRETLRLYLSRCQGFPPWKSFSWKEQCCRVLKLPLSCCRGGTGDRYDVSY